METNTTANPSQTTGPKKSFTSYIPHIVRILMGLMFLAFGLMGFLMPPPKDMPADMMAIMTSLAKAGYLSVASGTEIIVALLLLMNRFVPLALALITPIIVGMITFHIALAPSTIAPAIVVLVLELYLAWAYRNAFRPMLAVKVTPGAKPPSHV